MQVEEIVGSRPAPRDEDAIALLKDLVAIPSLSGQEHEAVSFLVGTMRRLGMDAYVDEAGNAVGSIGDGRPEILLVGHIDTVPGSIPVRVEDGKLYGRGAVDAKGPLAAFVAAMARLRAAGPIPGRIVVVGCVEEEAPSSRGAHAILRRYHPDFCIVGEPSGWDTLTLGYKGSLRANVRIAQGTAHSAHDRATAAEQGSDLWQRVRAWAAELNRGQERAWDQVLPTLVGIRSGGDGLQEWCDLDLSIRLPEDLAPSAVEAQLRAFAPEAALQVRGAVPAFRSPRTSPVTRALIGALREQGVGARFVVKTGTSDMNVVGPAWGCPIVTYGPGDASLDHTPDEHIILDDYLGAISVLERGLGMLIGLRTSAPA